MKLIEPYMLTAYSAKAQKRTLIVPDKDADGLSSGVILYRTLVALGLSEDLITAHLLTKGETVHSPSEAERMAAHEPGYIFVLDQGSRSSPAMVPSQSTTTLIIDHHHALESDFPEHSHHINASHFPPVATSSLLTYEICAPLHPSIPDQTAWLCCIGTHGDLGATLKWQPPFPDMSATLKQHTKSAITTAISLLNAPRRTATFDVLTAWTALLNASGPKDVAKDPRLNQARQEIAAEVERCTHTPPKFSKDGRVAVFRIDSEAQVHPLIATRWANHLKSKKLDVVMVANKGHLEGKVNFSCRIARHAKIRRSKEGLEDVDIISILEEYASQDESGELRKMMGESFARGHRQASGGIVDAEAFEALVKVMGVGEKPDVEEGKSGEQGKSPAKAKVNGVGGTPQKNTLANYFGKKGAG